MLECRDARGILRLVALDHELARPLCRAQLRMLVRREVSGDTVRMVGVIMRERDVRRPAAGELAGLRREPFGALRRVESLDGEHRVATGDEPTVGDRRAIAAEWVGDERPDAVGDAFEASERLARDGGA